MNRFIKIQLWVLLLGTLFAWGNFAREIYIWSQTQSTCGQAACSLPVVGAPTSFASLFITPCFMGALFFTAAFLLNILAQRRAKSQPDT